ncbi:MAG: adenine-specific methyltransferase EcoRI family protein [Vulcanibacillus sp.]
MSKNNNGINDEFYTPAESIINELKWYGYDGEFRRKTIYLPCDYDATLPYIKKEVKNTKSIDGFLEFNDEVTIYKVMPELFTEEDKKNTPRNCQFVAYLAEHKDDFGIKDIFISGYDALTGKGLRFQDAPFNEFDIIITNPPFSQMNEWINKIIDFSKKGGEFIFLAPLSILTNTFAFTYFKNQDFWCGYTEPNKYEDISGEKINSYLPSVWITNFDVKLHKRKRVLTKSWKDHPEDYLPYWNFKAININSILDIPYDYKGIIGVPATFMKDLLFEQFEIIGLGQGGNQFNSLEGFIDKESEGFSTDMIRTTNNGGIYSKNKTTAGVASSKIVLYTTIDLELPYKVPFARILIRLKEIDENREYYDYTDVINWATNELKTKEPYSVWSAKCLKTNDNSKVKQGKGDGKK